ncbi:hypothetical protein BEWA_011310 [Theileria equi strain WA]|uniref:Uncharacterized protein n=1 Tax=Theileria equi strain WA TaxID=1537102 RepID=L0B2J4_THEEQ|nr:hypothetical protein BEWA_011310 [Theileria equi strain WA]AFZ81713.1 hypothetical protein BEWA_011310 [Theileria equi strain WA]|eukprot:XP_004831379.1 hypothetical protein BEWA_011310 [Theileria equi strain WA]
MELTYVDVDNSELFYSHLLGNKFFSVGTQWINLERECSEQIKIIYKFCNVKNGNLEVDLDSMEIMHLDDSGSWVPASNIYGKPVYLESTEQISSIGKFINIEILENQLKMLNELMSLDPECKYLILSRIKILAFMGEKIDYNDLYTKISQIDSFRKSYYDDMNSQLKIRPILKRAISENVNSPAVDLSYMSIHTIKYRTITPYFHIHSLNLKGNNVSNKTLFESGIPLLIFIEHLDLSQNKIENLSDIIAAFKHINCIKRLDLSKNPITPIRDDTILGIRNIEEIDISQTPFAENILSIFCKNNFNSEKLPNFGNFIVNCELKEGYVITGSTDCNSFTKLSDQYIITLSNKGF